MASISFECCDGEHVTASFEQVGPGTMKCNVRQRFRMIEMHHHVSTGCEWCGENGQEIAGSTLFAMNLLLKSKRFLSRIFDTHKLEAALRKGSASVSLRPFLLLPRSGRIKTSHANPASQPFAMRRTPRQAQEAAGAKQARCSSLAAKGRAPHPSIASPPNSYDILEIRISLF